VNPTLRSLATLNGTDGGTSGRAAGGDYYPPPSPGSVTFDAPGAHTWIYPGVIGPVVIEVWGGGSSNDSGGLTSGADGGAGGGYASCEVGGPLWVAGAEVVIVVGAGSPGTPFTQGGEPAGDSTANTVGTLHLTGHGANLGVGGTGTVTQVGTAGSAIVTATGTNGTAHAGENGGAGGRANGGGGLGGAGHAAGVDGSPGQIPGGGGGGGGIQANNGAGGGGRVRISWPPA
jgi:hypothetical protein